MRIKKQIFLLIMFVFVIAQFTAEGQSNGSNGSNDGTGGKGGEGVISIVTPQVKDTANVLGYGFLRRIPGQWYGPVTTTTPAGSFDQWYVDFRPISAGEVAQYSMPDSQTVNNISYFIVKYNGQLEVAQRTEGCFAHKCCVTYEVMDSLNEAGGYYRFSDFCSGAKRAYTEFNFSGNSMIMKVFTSKFNKVSPPVLHSVYKAKLAGRTAANGAIAGFKYPQPAMIKDFTGVFNNMSESIYYNTDNDPYNALSQPELGNVTVNITIDATLKTQNKGELCIFLTTQPLFEGLKYIPANLKYLSKYIYLPEKAKTCTITNVHPGTYFVYSFDDLNRDKKHLKGDYMSSKLDNIVTVPTGGEVTVETKIDMVIP